AGDVANVRRAARDAPAAGRVGPHSSRAPAPFRRGRDSLKEQPMPLFMDRHDLPGTTAEMLAQAHLTDLQTQAKYDVQFLAYWFDADNGAVFCLAKAPQPEAMHAVHQEAHGMVPNEIIGVSEDSVVRFLGKISDPSEDRPATSGLRTILFTDLEGSTALLQEVGEAAYMGHLGEHDLII